MKIEITSQAKEYIKRNDIDTIRAEIYSSSTCCGVYYRPMVFENAPKDENFYELYNEEGLKIWVDKMVNLEDDTLTIGYDKYNDYERLTLSGVQKH